MSHSPAPTGSLRILQKGKKYMQTWPNEKRLAVIFPENRVIQFTRFGIRYMPFLAVFTLTWQIAMGGQLGPAVATALFACSLPMQGLWWLGKRAQTPLPPRLRHWFQEMRDKLLSAGHSLAPQKELPTYQSLAELLKRVFKQFDQTFLDDL
ncbi:MAG: terminus macrodomain insulation protein YfbV [Enterobacteriaceae bacterium]